MSPAIASSLGIVAYLAIFALTGVAFLFVNLLVGMFLRPHDPHPEKLEIYECGEPTIGSSFVQFDLRFYVVALLFVIFDVEVAFFFPWATVFGKANQLAGLEQRLDAAQQNMKNVGAESNPKNLPLAELPDAQRAKLEDAARQLAEVQGEQRRLSHD